MSILRDSENLADEIALGIGLLPKKNKQVNTEVLFTEDAVCVAKKKHPIFSKKLNLHRYLSFKHLAINYIPGSTASFIDSVLEAKRLKREVAIYVPDVMSALTLLMKSDLVGTFPKLLIQDFVGPFRLSTTNVPFEVTPCEVNMFWHTRYDDDPAHQWLRQSIKALLS